MSSKFNVRVTGCSGAVVVGDNAHLNVGTPATDGKCGEYASIDTSVSLIGFYSRRERVVKTRVITTHN